MDSYEAEEGRKQDWFILAIFYTWFIFTYARALGKMIHLLCKTASRDPGDTACGYFLHMSIVTENNDIDIEGYCLGSSNVNQVLCGYAFISQTMKDTV